MVELTIVPYVEIPANAVTTKYALMPKVLCCIEGDRAKVYVNRTVVRRFKHVENGLLKQTRLYLREKRKAGVILLGLTENSPIFLKARKRIVAEPKEQLIGFDNAI